MPRGFGQYVGGANNDLLTSRYKSSGSNKRSYSVWFFSYTSVNTPAGRIFDKGGSSPGWSEILAADGTGTTISFNRANASNTVTSHYSISGFTFTAVTWQHVLVTHDQSAGLTAPSFYIDGVSYSATSGGASGNAAANNTAPFTFGNRAGDQARVWSGALAHAAIWDEVLLDAGAALALAAGAHPMTIAPGNCVLYMPFDGISSPEWDAVNWMSSGIVGTRFFPPAAGKFSLYIPTDAQMRHVYGASAPPPASRNGPMISLIM